MRQEWELQLERMFSLVNALRHGAKQTLADRQQGRVGRAIDAQRTERRAQTLGAAEHTLTRAVLVRRSQYKYTRDARIVESQSAKRVRCGGASVAVAGVRRNHGAHAATGI